MTPSFLSLLALVAAGASALSIAGTASPALGSPALAIRDTSEVTPGCQNTKTSRKCWGEHNIDTNYYDTIFRTGKTVEYWLTVEEIDCAPDGYLRKCMVANGTMPGPAIIADWGDDIVVHVTNNIADNGTAIHWHGIRQLNSSQYDGVPGISQCPIAPGQSMTYKFHASQYGTTMYHSHFTLQYDMGLYGPLIINGPATADYDVDLGPVFLTDWDHQTAFYQWATIANFNVTFDGMSTGLINGMNTGNCTLTNATRPDPRCLNGGKKHEIVFEAGKKHRLRLINLATEAWFQFSIDGHKLTVIAADLVPIVPYQTDTLLINMGQRYDVIIEANAKPADYWLRGGFVDFCIPNGLGANITGIVRYNKDSTKDPVSKNVWGKIETCLDEPATSLVPWVPIDLTNIHGGIKTENVTGEYYVKKFLRWSFNQPDAGFIWTNWSQPALGDAVSGDFDAIPRSNNVFQVGDLNTSTASKKETEWVVLVTEELTPIPGISHPMHLHGHDFLVLKAASGRWDGTTRGWEMQNPPRRDTATMPPNGHLIIAWALDNPGVWLMHCHIAWHSSQGFGVTVLESPDLIPGLGISGDWKKDFAPACDAWNKWYPTSPHKQDDSGV